MRTLAFLSLLVACETTPVAPPEEPKPEFTCETACENLRGLRCPEARDTPEGSKCEDVCENSFEVGIPQFEWDLQHETTTTECED